MHKKRILVLAPILTLPEDLGPFLSRVAFLEPNYRLEGLDPLLDLSNLDNEQYYLNWQNTLSELMHQYDAFIGFSFGAVILQQCFPLFHSKKKRTPIILFSAPSFADNPLNEKLMRILRLAQEKKLEAANQLKMNYVLHPHPEIEIKMPVHNTELGCARLIEGITRILTTDSRTILQKYPVKYHHFIGEHSYLVNRNNVITGQAGNVFHVPGASMHVLQDNSIYCYKKIEEIL